MYTAKEEYYKALYENPVVKSYVTGAIALDDGEVSISDQNIIKGSLSINNRCVNGTGFEYGAVYQGEMNITLMIDAGRYSLYDKKISLTAHYVLDDEEEVSIPLGQWKITTPERSKKLLTIKALDAMSDFSEIIPEAFTGTAYEMLTAACTACGVPLGMTRAEVEALTNGKVSFYANTEYFDTYRDLLSYLGKCTCTFATIDRNGALVLREYGTEPVKSIPATRRSDTVVTDYETYYKGVRMRFLAEENFFPYEKGCGEDGITMDLGDIPIVNGTPEAKQAVCDAICAKLASVRYTPVHFVQLVGDPTLELGDMITVDDANTYVMAYTWNHHGSMRIQGLGEDPKHPKLKNKNQVDIPALNDTLAGLEEDFEELDEGLQQALKEATALINGTEGGYFTVMTDKVMVDGVEKEVPIGWRIMDTPSLHENTKLWQMSLGGFAFSADGGRTFSNVAIDMNGTLNCNNINVTGLVVGKNVTMGDDATISWEQVTEQPTIIDASTVTTITRDAISAANIRADQVSAGSFYMTGGSIAINTSSSSENRISLTHGLNQCLLSPVGFRFGTESQGIGGVLGVLDATHGIRVGGVNVSLEGHDHDGEYYGGSYLPFSNSGWTYRIYGVHYNTSSSTTSNATCGYSSADCLLPLSSSSERYKHNIHEMDEELIEKIRGLYDVKVKCWTYNDGYLEDGDELVGKETFGLIAEDVAAVLPEAVHHKNGMVENYRDRHLLNAMLVLMQEQKKEIEDLKARVEKLEKGVM